MESMTAHRPYRPSLGTEVALAELTDHQGTRYDGDAVEACRRLFEDTGFDWSVTTSSWTATPLTADTLAPEALGALED